MGFINYLKNFGIVALSFFGALLLVVVGVTMTVEKPLIGIPILASGGMVGIYGYYRREEWSKQRKRSRPFS